MKSLDLVLEHQQKIQQGLTAAWHAYNKGDKEMFEQVWSELKISSIRMCPCLHHDCQAEVSSMESEFWISSNTS